MDRKYNQLTLFDDMGRSGYHETLSNMAKEGFLTFEEYNMSSGVFRDYHLNEDRFVQMADEEGLSAALHKAWYVGKLDALSQMVEVMEAPRNIERETVTHGEERMYWLSTLHKEII